MPVAATFEWEFEDGFRLGDIARLDTMVTVVDASTFLAEVVKGHTLADRDMQAAPGDERTIADLLIDQVEFANVLILNKIDLVSANAVGTVEATIRRLNPVAHIVRAERGVVELAEVLGTGHYNPDIAAQFDGWDDELAGGHTPETEEYGISSLTFTADRPFHPARLEAVLAQLNRLLRSKGFCWLASRPEVAALWSQAGPNLTFEAAAYWTALEMPPGQELVFIGVRLNRPHIRDLLNTALLTDAELAAGPRAWARYPDPFPSWGELHEHA